MDKWSYQTCYEMLLLKWSSKERIQKANDWNLERNWYFEIKKQRLADQTQIITVNDWLKEVKLEEGQRRTVPGN